MTTEHGGDWAGFEEEYGCMPIDFSASISPLGLPEGVRRAAARALDTADRYPDPLCRKLRGRLSEVHGVPENRIVCGNGAADLIHRICSWLRPRHAVLTAPDFGEYRKALEAAGCEISCAAARSGERFGLNPAVMDAVGRETDIVFLSNPNNPSGAVAGEAELRHLLCRCEDCGCLLVVDECFMDFADEPEKASMIPAVAEARKLMVLRAFTKTYAMAGLRLGYVLCGSGEDAEGLRREGQPWAVSHIAQEAGLAALEEKDYVRKLRSLVREERERMACELREMGFDVAPGEANYLLFRGPDDDLCGRLEKRRILIRDCGSFEGLCPGWYRVAVRTETENSALLSALREVL